MRTTLMALGVSAVMVIGVAAQEASHRILLFNPYDRPKNGPPLTNVFYKVKPSWLLKKLQQPRHHPSARMPNFEFSEEEALDVMAYLKSQAKAQSPERSWPAWAEKGFEEMDDEELETVMKLADSGKAVWGNARCTICHKVNGPGGELIGGFVDLRVGGIDLEMAGTKLTRDWLYDWIQEPKRYFPNTLMPHFRFSDSEIRALVEFILRDDAFLASSEEEEEEKPQPWPALDEIGRASRGKRLIELSRCVICHDIAGVADLFTLPAAQAPVAPAGSFEFLAYDLRCLSCHSIEGRGGTYAPDLTNEGSRLQKAWVTKFLKSPDMVRPLSQQMPKFELSTGEAEILAGALARRREDRIPERIPGDPITADDRRLGQAFFEKKGCIACHTVGDGAGGVVGPDLADVPKRLKPGFVWYHLKHPHDINPQSAEPDYGLSDEEARVLAAYLTAKRK